MTIRTLLAGLTCLSLGACALAPGPFLDSDRLDNTRQPEYAQQKYTVEPIDNTYFLKVRAAVHPSVCPLTCLTSAERADYDYRIGNNDQLTIIVWDHPELTGGGTGVALPPIPQGAVGAPTPGNSTSPQGSTLAATPTMGSGETGLPVRVARDGTIFFPRVGRIKVTGLSTQEVRDRLAKGLAKTIRDPQIDVRVSGFNSQIVQVTGNVKNPTPESITDLPLSILDAINRAGGALPDADLQNVGLTRNGKRYRVDVASLLETGDPNQNVILKDGDLVDIPDRSDSRVFVLGEVTRPTSLPMNRGKLTLADAIAGVNSLDVRNADPRSIYVIRAASEASSGRTAGAVPATVNLANNTAAGTAAATTPGTPGAAAPTLNVYRLDMTQVDAIMLMTKFELQPRDVVYVQVASAARFNRILDTITPALQTLFFTKELAP
jgi:polysaccharide biosynthesis/export protein